MASASPFTETENIQHLNVPAESVSFGAHEFTICSLYSVTEYFANHYPDEGVRRGTTRPTMDDLRQIISSDEGGWRPKQEKLSQLSNMVKSVEFRLDSWGQTAPMRLSSLLQDHIGRYCPLIAYVDGLRIHEGGDVKGPIYSVVVAGFDRGHAVIIDPWDGQKKIVTHQKLEASWDEEQHQVIKVKSANGPLPEGDW